MAIIPKFFSKNKKKEKASSVKKTFNGRASAKRLNSRVSDLEDKSGSDNPQIHENEDTDFAEEFAKLTKNEKNRLINPLKIDNLSVTQVFAGWDKTDIRFAQRISIKNTRLLEKFTKAAEKIAVNTTYKKDQDTSIKNQRKKKQNRLNVAVSQKKSKDGYGYGEGKGGLGLSALLGAGALLLWGAIKLAWGAIKLAWGVIKLAWKGMKLAWKGMKLAWRGIVKFWKKYISPFIKKVWKGIVKFWKKHISPFIKKTWSKVKKFWKKNVTPFVEKTWSKIKGFWKKNITPFVEKTWSKIKSSWTTIKNWVKGTWDVVAKQYKAIVDWAGDKVKKVVKKAKKVGKVIKNTAVKVVDKSKKLIKGAKQIASKFGGWLSDLYSNGKAALKKSVSVAMDKVKWVASKGWKLFKKLAPKILKRALIAVVGVLLGAATIAGAPIITAIAGAALLIFEIWAAYTIAIDLLIATGVLTEEQVENAENAILHTASFGYLGNETPKTKEVKKFNTKRQTKVNKQRQDKKAEELIKLKEEIDGLRLELKAIT